MSEKLNDKFNPKEFEERIYKNWESKKYFNTKIDKTKEPFTIVIPPPNITGKLHMGHALDNTLQDILIRYKRMNGYNALWVPGTDHAAIATEAKIVEKLKEEGISKEDLGREGFLKRAWEWKEEYGGAIINQLKKLGCSCDWDRERFTMDEGLSHAVNTVFINLYNKGLIYKGKKMINWCPYCNTSISDAEVEHEEEATHLWHITYKAEDGNGEIVVATTRPETMLGDTAVAVYPEDERYKNLVGKNVILPIMNKPIPIITDEFVEKEFGTGAVKITPAHDMNDYEAGLRHNLDIIEVFDADWNMGSLVPEYEGLDLHEARKLIVEELKKQGLLVKEEDYTHNVNKCYRCHKTIEPKISTQWFVKMKPLAEPAIEAVKSRETEFVPDRFSKIYFNWMENIQDWCISRQLWWGHRIPAYYCEECGEINVAESKPEKCTKCGSKELKQDEDTLDTWFSSALWPFSTLGWPEKTEDLEYFYPTSVLVTGYDIIFFWVARMIFSGIEHMKETPFKNVLIHGLIRDSQGRKMSKSLGNGIDPIDIINEFGTDALRFSLVQNTSPGMDIRYSKDRLEAASNFSNKIWNASKFVLMNFDDNFSNKFKSFHDTINLEDKWILSKLNKLIKEVNSNIENFDLGIALEKIYNFIWNEFCDWYIEIVKPRLYDENSTSKETAQYVLNKVLQDSLKLLHPFMPFITEEIYTRLPGADETIMLSQMVKYNEEFRFESEENMLEEIKEIIVQIRNIRTTNNVHPSKKSTLIFVTKFEEEIKASENFLQKLGFSDKIIVQKDKKDIPKNAISIITKDIECFIPFEELVDIAEEKQRLETEKQKCISEIERVEKMLANPGFTSKAPESKINEEKEKKAKYEQMLKTIEERLKQI